jgi:hypothetical protein
MMTLFKKIPISFEEKQYEIRVLYDETTVNVVAFLQNHPANGFRHQVKMPKHVDIKGILEMNAAEDLIELCKNDILEKRWEKWGPIIRENKKVR